LNKSAKCSNEQKGIIDDRFSDFESVGNAAPKGILNLNILYNGKVLLKKMFNNYFVLGSLTQDLGSMKITLLIEEKSSGRKERIKIDLYEQDELNIFSQQLSSIFNQNVEEILADLKDLANELELFRENQIGELHIDIPYKRRQQQTLPENKNEICQFLTERNLIGRIDQLLEKTGICGEENNRKLLFIAALSYKMFTPINAILQGSSGSGKNYLLKMICKCFPPEDIVRVPFSGIPNMHHFRAEDFNEKLIVLEDLDLMSQKSLVFINSIKDSEELAGISILKLKQGYKSSTSDLLRSSFLATSSKPTNSNFDLNSTILICIDESEEQTKKILEFQNNYFAGLFDEKRQKCAQNFLQNCIRCLKRHEVINPFATNLVLPPGIKFPRSFNRLYNIFINQVTLLHQYQRKKDAQNRLITEPEDIRIVNEILLDSLMLRIDDLNPSLRQFYEKLKVFHKRKVGKASNECKFNGREIRLAMQLSKTTCFRNLKELVQMGYLTEISDQPKSGHYFMITHWDNLEKIKLNAKKKLSEVTCRKRFVNITVQNNINHNNIWHQSKNKIDDS
jgi:hypothetical protein